MFIFDGNCGSRQAAVNQQKTLAPKQEVVSPTSSFRFASKDGRVRHMMDRAHKGRRATSCFQEGGSESKTTLESGLADTTVHLDGVLSNMRIL